jgi:CRISPR-associated protein (TIGR02584 family)
MKTILIATIGSSPAVLTETVWALARPSRIAPSGLLPEAVIPDEVVVLTTASGAEKINAALFGENSVWTALRKALKVSDTRLTLHPPIVFSLPDGSGGTRPLADIRTAEENQAAADRILREVCSYAKDEEFRLIGSLAGGRKTMSALLHAAFTLAARPGDRLLHILVSEPYETLPGFFFPNQPQQALQTRDKKTLRAKDAKFDLIDVPLVPLGNFIREKTGKDPATFAGLQNAARSAIGDLRLEIGPLDAFPHWIKINTVEHKLTPLQYGYLRFFAEHTEKFTSAKDIFEPLKEFLSQRIDGVDPGNLDDSNVIKRLSDLKKALPALASVLPGRGNWRINLPSDKITLN